MKGVCGLLGFLLITGLLLMPGSTYASSLQDMALQLDQHRKEIDALKASKDTILADGNKAFVKVESSLRDAEYIYRDLKIDKSVISALIDKGENLCNEAKSLRQKQVALAAAVADGEALINTKINSAKARKANCIKPEDDIFVKNNYLAAQKALATMEKAQKAAFETRVEINVKFEQIKKTNKELSQHQHDRQKMQGLKQKHHDLLALAAQYLDQLKMGLKEAKGFPVKVQALKTKIEDSKKYYIQYFPKAASDFDRLIKEVSLINLSYVIDPAWLSDLQDKYQREEMALNERTHPSLRKSTPSISCISDKEVKAVMDEIDAAFFRTVLVIKANQLLSTGCQLGSSTPQITTSEEAADLPAGGGTPPNIPPVTTTSSDPPVKSNFGGLIIAGPTQITVGQGVSYVACDGDGQPYTTGSFSWNHSREDILVLPRSGNPVTGTAFKPGKVTMFVKYEGMKAYLDIEIKAKEESLFSSSGGEEDTDDDDNLFSSSGGEEDPGNNNNLSSNSGSVEADSMAEGQPNNQLQQQCSNLVDLVVWSLNRHDADSAQSYTNQAVALGCNIDVGKVNSVVSQIHDIKIREEQQRERMGQQQLQQQTASQQPQNQTNWGDVTQLLGQMMHDMQKGYTKPSRNQKPLPSADSTWQSHQVSRQDVPSSLLGSGMQSYPTGGPSKPPSTAGSGYQPSSPPAPNHPSSNQSNTSTGSSSSGGDSDPCAKCPNSVCIMGVCGHSSPNPSRGSNIGFPLD